MGRGTLGVNPAEVALAAGDDRHPLEVFIGQTNMEISPDDHLEFDIALDSLGKLSLIDFIDKTFGVKIEEDKLLKFPSIRKLVDFISDNKLKHKVESIDWSAILKEKVVADFPLAVCRKCNRNTIYPVCESCHEKTESLFFCETCGAIQNCPHEKKRYSEQSIPIKHFFGAAMKSLDEQSSPDLVKGVRGTSNKDHIPEHFVKGIFRAKYDICVNKDGTTRYDMTQLPITHFKPKEVGTSVERLKELGYGKDIHRNELTDVDQVLELLPQDIILPACKESPELGADKILLQTTFFIDELLTEFYKLEAFYNYKSENDLAGALVIVLAPHTAAAVIGRFVGFSKTQGFYAHPLFHAATRRDCDGDEASAMMLMDALLNFSRDFLPDSRGASQDAPLVLTSRLIPSEVDDMVFDLDVSWRYPLEFYEACLEYKQPTLECVAQLGDRLNTEQQYEKIGFTHPTSNINKGVKCSAYKTLPSMEEKLKGQMDLANKIRAVDEVDVARLVIEKHFLRDIKGNLRKFSTQEFRCVKCNEKFRRPPLIGKCTNCGGRIIFTVSEGSIIKYLDPAISLAEHYHLPSYLMQTLELTKRMVESIFGKEKERQSGLGKWF